jgi:hypothetical protein
VQLPFAAHTAGAGGMSDEKPETGTSGEAQLCY